MWPELRARYRLRLHEWLRDWKAIIVSIVAGNGIFGGPVEYFMAFNCHNGRVFIQTPAECSRWRLLDKPFADMQRTTWNGCWDRFWIFDNPLVLWRITSQQSETIVLVGVYCRLDNSYILGYILWGANGCLRVTLAPCGRHSCDPCN